MLCFDVENEISMKFHGGIPGTADVLSSIFAHEKDQASQQ